MTTKARIVTFFAIRTIGRIVDTMLGGMVNAKNEDLYLLPADKEGMKVTSAGNYIHWGPKFENPIKEDNGRRFFITPIAGELAGVIRERSVNLVEYIKTPRNTPLELILKPEVPATIVKFIDERNFIRILTKDSGLEEKIKENLRKEQWTMLRCPYAIKVKVSRVQEINDLTWLCWRSIKQIQEVA